MIHKQAAPGVESPKEPKLSVELGSCDILHSPRAFFEQDVEHQSLVGADDRTQFRRHGERNQVIRHRQQSRRLALEPFLRLAVPALGAGAMTAVVIRKVLMSAFAVVAAPSALWRMARQDRPDRLVMRGQDVLCAVPGHVLSLIHI